MTIVYCAFSNQLNYRALNESGDLYLFKFGFTTGDKVPLERFNKGWEEPEGTFSQPLAGCTDWREVGIWQARKRTEAKIIDEILKTEFHPFSLKSKILAEIHAIDPLGISANDNGINEIRRIKYEDIPRLNAFMKAADINDPLVPEVINFVCDYVASLFESNFGSDSAQAAE